MFIIAFFKEFRDRLPAASFKRRVLHHFQNELKTLASRRPDLSRMNFTLIPWFDLWGSEGSRYTNVRKRKLFFGSEDASRCSAQVLFKGHLICQDINQLILHQKRHPHFGGSTVVDGLFVNVYCTVYPGSRKAWSRSGTAFGRGRYYIWRKDLTGAPTSWHCCQYRLEICWGRPVKFYAISFDWIG